VKFPANAVALKRAGFCGWQKKGPVKTPSRSGQLCRRKMSAPLASSILVAV